jgi:hypothetical protein
LVTRFSANAWVNEGKRSFVDSMADDLVLGWLDMNRQGHLYKLMRHQSHFPKVAFSRYSHQRPLNGAAAQSLASIKMGLLLACWPSCILARPVHRLGREANIFHARMTKQVKLCENRSDAFQKAVILIASRKCGELAKIRT